ncbi:hypothetical protein BDN71DRAFT_1592049 [Pleurotus eryngii]|uniref:Uncharacterized protein n=1 Tax=Pleurotus eryngii TaxID=5323 RepID=A0A9P5ZSG8_PLEER|nr:hypothetical protein BDN71DRAFT_1592049 [Pleurotus eryngii]
MLTVLIFGVSFSSLSCCHHGLLLTSWCSLQSSAILGYLWFTSTLSPALGTPSGLSIGRLTSGGAEEGPTRQGSCRRWKWGAGRTQWRGAAASALQLGWLFQALLRSAPSTFSYANPRPPASATTLFSFSPPVSSRRRFDVPLITLDPRRQQRLCRFIPPAAYSVRVTRNWDGHTQSHRRRIAVDLSVRLSSLFVADNTLT